MDLKLLLKFTNGQTEGQNAIFENILKKKFFVLSPIFLPNQVYFCQ